MAAEAVPLSVAYDGNLRITLVDSGVNAKSAAVLVAGTDLTYSLKKFTRGFAEAVIDDPRLTLKQILQRRGKVTETLEVQYIFGDDDDVAYAALPAGTVGQLGVRYSEPNETAWAATQIEDVITFQAGVQRKDEPVENGIQTVTQTLFITAPTEFDAAVVA